MSAALSRAPARYAGAFLVGALTVLGFAPFYLWPVPLLTLAVLIHLWRDCAARKDAWWIGFAFGMGFFLVGASWIYISLHVYGGMPAWLTALVTLVFCIVLSLFPAMTGALQAWVGGAWLRRSALVIPACWTVLEWLRGWILTGFPFLSLGYSQVPDAPLAAIAPVFGVYGVSFVLLVVAALLSQLRAAPRTSAIALAILVTASYALRAVTWVQPAGAPISVTLLQGNISQDIKFREEMLPQMFASYLGLTLASEAKLIVLPESAFPVFRHELPQNLLTPLADHAKRNGGDILYGVFDADREKGEIFNTVWSIGSAPAQSYRKHHLVAFGEFIPAKPLIGWIYDNILHMPLADQTPGAAYQKPLEVAGQKVAVNICYEDAFGAEIIRQLPAATMLVNVSNDGWFGDSLGPQQHLQIAQMRALETGRYLLRGTNTGITAIIDERGRSLARAPQFEVATLSGAAQGFQGATPYVEWGNVPIIATALALLLAVAWRQRQRRERIQGASQ